MRDLTEIPLDEWAEILSKVSSTEIAESIATKIDKIIDLNSKQLVTIDELKSVHKKRSTKLRLMRQEIDHRLNRLSIDSPMRVSRTAEKAT